MLFECILFHYWLDLIVNFANFLIVSMAYAICTVVRCVNVTLVMEVCKDGCESYYWQFMHTFTC